MRTPVALFIYKRPQTTYKVFEAIREAQPQVLYVIANAPNPNYPDEQEKSKATRRIINTVDWKCEVVKKYADTYSHCSKQLIGGFNWLFSNVEEAIILEDDCVPHPTFFPFCEELLAKYRYDNRITSISGTNYLLRRIKPHYSYYFSIFNHCWGWASWKRAWQSFDINMSLWQEISTSKVLENILPDKNSVSYWTKILQTVDNSPEGINWDCQWTFACWMQSGLGIIPKDNLVSNIGFGLDSTNCHSQKSPYYNMPRYAMAFPLQHPPFVVRDLKPDKFTQRTLFKEKYLRLFIDYLKNTIKRN